MKNLFLFLCFALASLALSAQSTPQMLEVNFNAAPKAISYVSSQLIVEGTVKGVYGRDLDPLPVANVIIENTGTGTLTDFDGHFSLEVQPGTFNLVFKYVGYENLIVPISIANGEIVRVDVIMVQRKKDRRDPVITRRRIEPAANEVTASQAPLKTSALPLMSITNNAISFVDANKNNALDAFEQCKLQFEVKNTGKGDGTGLAVMLTAKGSNGGVTFRSSTTLPVIKPGATYLAEVPLSANESTLNGSAVFSLKVDEPNGLGSDMVDIEIPTKAFVSPLVKVVDYTITGESGNNLARRQPFNLQVLVQNAKTGTAESVSATLKVPQYVLLISGEEYTSIGSLKVGATKDITYSLIVTDKYEQQTIPLTVQLREKHGKYAEDKTITLNLNQALSANKIRITAAPDNAEEAIIPDASLTSDVDKNIPINATINEHRYALVIGNEDYSSYQSGLSKEVNVDFAVNDARVFKEYCIKTLGIPEKQIKLLTNATTGQMNQGFAWLNNLAKVDNGSAELIVYYSGHGLPDETTKDPYLIPVDVSGSNVTQGIALNTVYGKLTEFPAQKVTVFLDACFSGGARNQGLVAMKGVKIKPKDNVLNGNMVVFASSSGEESSGVYRDKQHGYMTYYLLKKLQESKGDITYSRLADYVTQNVKKETALSGKIQTPQVIYSTGVAGIWSGWSVK